MTQKNKHKELVKPTKPIVVAKSTYTPPKTALISSISMTKCSRPIKGYITLPAPTVYYTKEAWETIEYIVDKSTGEIGWLGLVEEHPTENYYLITEIFIPEQIVTSVTTDIEPEALVELTMKLLDEGKDPTQLRYWGHSHVNMGVSPSPTDELQLEEYLNDVDWFIRGIYNKKGVNKVDVYDVSFDVVHQCVDNEIIVEEILPERIVELDAILATNIKRPVYTTRPPVRHRRPVYHTSRPANTGGASQTQTAAAFLEEFEYDTKIGDYRERFPNETQEQRNERIITAHQEYSSSSQMIKNDEGKSLEEVLSNIDEINQEFIENMDLFPDISCDECAGLSSEEHIKISNYFNFLKYDPDYVFTNDEIYQYRLSDPFYVSGE